MVDASTTASTAVPAAATVTGSGVVRATSVRGVVGAPASSAGVAVAETAPPPDDASETAAARGRVFPTPPVDWTTARHDPPPETTTT